MLKSMTGFGKTDFPIGNKLMQVEIRSLNNKNFDISLKIPSFCRDKESEIRTILGNLLQRGKVDIIISFDTTMFQEIPFINTESVKANYAQLKALAGELGINLSGQSMELFLSAIKMSDTFQTASDKLNENEWSLILQKIHEAAGQLNSFRIHEGKVLENDLTARVRLILDLLKTIVPFEKARIDRFREKIDKQLIENFQNCNYDKNRFEQELIYYIEKLDITEEKIRLEKHCEYFIEMMNKSDSSGKKLGFIAQEIGREINTLGAKANDFEIQKMVVQMKDELEKIKEQLMNVL